MGYLICQNCGGYYKLKEGESPEDFVACQCYGPLVYVERLDNTIKSKKKDEYSKVNLSDDNSISVFNVEDKAVEVESNNNVGTGSEDLKQDSKNQHEEEPTVKSVSGNVKNEPTIKNRAYYRRFYYYTEPDINQLKQKKDVTGIVNALYYDDPKIQQEAAQALAVIGDERALEHLNKIIKEERGSLKLYAEIAVNQINSKKHGFKSRNRETYRNISNELAKTPIKPSESIPKTDVTKIDEDRKRKPDLSATYETTMVPKSEKSSLTGDKHTENEVQLKTYNDFLATPTISKDIPTPLIVKHSKKEKTEIESSKVLQSDIKPEEIETSKTQSPDIDLKGTEVSEFELKEAESTEVKILSDKRDKISPTETQSLKTGISEVNSEEVKSSEVKPETPDVTTKTIKSLDDFKKNSYVKSTSITMETVDKTELAPIEKDIGTANKPTADLNSKSKNIRKSKLSPTSTSLTTPKKDKPIKSSPETIQNKTNQIQQKRLGKTENTYFIRGLRIKKSDKQLIFLITLLIIALIVGVVLTISST